ncbi:MAG: aldehyde dehydrogenase family protein [Desulfarculus sp.]|nr:aldehyde dehydrogenase family protein [Desulfarculus sp.]
MKSAEFRLTYATMFDPPQRLHDLFDAALEGLLSKLGNEYPLTINGKSVRCPEKFEDLSPADDNQILGVFQQAGAAEAQRAVAAARAAFTVWSKVPWQRRVELLRRVAEIIRERCFTLAAALSLSVGKNRMEALGDAAETADLLDYACDQMEGHQGFVEELPRDPLPGLVAHNVSVLRPYGPWLVVSPFNFPCALSGGPAGAALLAGNTVIVKCASDTPLAPRLLADCFLEAGLPDGAFNFLTGPGDSLGQALSSHPDLAGVTFTGSHGVGMAIHRQWAQGPYVRPVILELGGKNPAIVTQNADLDVAALGVMRSAFGLQGQKCSACSRIYVERPVYAQFVERLLALTQGLTMGDPTRRDVYLGPVINRRAQAHYLECCQELARAGELLCGGVAPDQGEMARGSFCAPTLAAQVPQDHPLWRQEMFLPIALLAPVDDLEQALALAKDTIYGLTAGLYGNAQEARRFFEEMEAGVCYANRPTGATTGAWPGMQPFGGCKASGAAGKNAGGPHYLQLYLREQVRAQIVRSNHAPE